MIEISAHNVGTVELETVKSGDSKWLQVNIYDERGNQIGEVTLFAVKGKSIALKLGDDE